MESYSRQVYIPHSREEFDVYFQQRRFNMNGVSIQFATLKDRSKMAMGDPIFCGACGASVNSFSKIQAPNADGKRVWKCEFCAHDNLLVVEDEELPKDAEVEYVLQSNQQVQQNTDSDICVVFCIDNSGSMSVTSEIKGQNLQQLKRSTVSQAEIESLKQFMEPGELQQYLAQLEANNARYVSRKNAVLAAIESQLDEQRRLYPNRRIGLVVFGDDVCVVGDGHETEVTLAGEKLQNEALLIAEGQKLYASHMHHSVSDSHERLLAKFERLHEGGRTALGPALATAVGLASRGKPGSVVVMCTDGLANVGVGALDVDAEGAQAFYDHIGDTAKEHGVLIQTVTMKGEQCNALQLGRLAEKTNGRITRVNPENIQQDFASALKEECVATGVSIRVLLHKGLKFENDVEDESTIFQGQMCNKKVGNVTAKKSVSFSYDLKLPPELEAEKIDLTGLKELPMQAQIFYTSMEGHQLVRIITKTQTVSNNKEDVKKSARVDLIGQHVQRQTAQLALRGQVQEAQTKNRMWSAFAQEDLASEPEHRTAALHAITMSSAVDHIISKKSLVSAPKSEQKKKNLKVGMSAQSSSLQQQAPPMQAPPLQAPPVPGSQPSVQMNDGAPLKLQQVQKPLGEVSEESKAEDDDENNSDDDDNNDGNAEGAQEAEEDADDVDVALYDLF